MFDLKGSTRNRMVDPKKRAGQVLMDENLVESECDFQYTLILIDTVSDLSLAHSVGQEPSLRSRGLEKAASSFDLQR